MRSDEQRRAEALDLQRPRRLPHDAVPHAARREDEERQDDDRDDSGREAETQERLTPSARAPDVRKRNGDQHRRPDLHGDARAEQSVPEAYAAGDERRERPGRKRRRPEVEARQHHRPEQQRRDRRERERAVQTCARRTESGQRDRERDERGCAADPHQRTERAVVRVEVALVAERRQNEDRQRSGGYSSEKSRYGTWPCAIRSPYFSYTGVSTICPPAK